MVRRATAGELERHVMGKSRTYLEIAARDRAGLQPHRPSKLSAQAHQALKEARERADREHPEPHVSAWSYLKEQRKQKRAERKRDKEKAADGPC